MSSKTIREKLQNRKTDIVALIQYLIVGVFVTILLVLLETYVENIPLGHRVEMLAYEFLHHQIAPFSTEMPVVVLDISQIPGGQGNAATSRKELRAILDELVNQKPRAIAIDIDFSPNASGWIDKSDPDFFEFCLDQRKRGVPIVLGVYRTASQRPEAWLGSQQFKDLAGDMTINTDDTSRLRLWVQQGEQEPLPSISAALIKADGMALPQVPARLKFALDYQVQIENSHENDSLHSAYALVNYSKLEAIQSQSVTARSPQSIRDLAQKFHNKFVIIGDGTTGQASDTFIIPGRSVPIPGVYLHASAVYSLTVEPFYELKYGFRILMDLSLSFLILIFVSVARWKRQIKTFDWHRLQRQFVWGTVVLIIFLGIVAVRALDVLWLNFFFVIFALLFHPSVESRIAKLFARIGSAWSRGTTEAT